jgi:DNA-binding NarL/FixJ family response regulator
MTDLVVAVGARLPRGIGVMATMLHMDQHRRLDATRVMVNHGPDECAALATSVATVHPVLPYCLTVSGFVRFTEFGNKEGQRLSARAGVLEAACVLSADGGGQVLGISALLSSPYTPTNSDRRFWVPVAHHIGHALRLRRRLERMAEEDTTEAVLAPDGRVLDASGPARSPTLLARLRNTALARERARSRRADPDAFWDGLVAGRWTLVDRFDRDGSRYLVAHRNDLPVMSASALTSGQARVLARAAAGWSNKRIALELGMSEAWVSVSLARALKQTGLLSPADLAAAAPSARSFLEFDLDGDTLGVLVRRKPVGERLPSLTPTERTIVADLLAGLDNREIAFRRCRSQRTVANQVQSIFRKLGVGSRRELAVRFS